MCGRFPRKFDVHTSDKPSNHVLELIFVVNIKSPRATCHTIVPLTEELYCLIRGLIYLIHACVTSQHQVLFAQSLYQVSQKIRRKLPVVQVVSA